MNTLSDIIGHKIFWLSHRCCTAVIKRFARLHKIEIVYRCTVLKSSTWKCQARAVPQTASLALVPPPTAAPAPAIGPGRTDDTRTAAAHLESPLPRGCPRPPTCPAPPCVGGRSRHTRSAETTDVLRRRQAATTLPTCCSPVLRWLRGCCCWVRRLRLWRCRLQWRGGCGLGCASFWPCHRQQPQRRRRRQLWRRGAGAKGEAAAMLFIGACRRCWVTTARMACGAHWCLLTPHSLSTT